jgi:predicted metal-dependent hydrolase
VTKARILNLPEIGSVLFEPSRRARRLNVTVSASLGIRVAVPPRISLKQAVRFVESKQDWIQRTLINLRQQQTRLAFPSLDSLGLSEQEAKTRLKNRLAELAALYDFSYNRVFVRRQKTRWGSCSVRNNINLNLKILLLPSILQDYVLLHELVHTRIKNHSPEFWRELGRWVGDAKGLSRRLRQYPL